MILRTIVISLLLTSWTLLSMDVEAGNLYSRRVGRGENIRDLGPIIWVKATDADDVTIEAQNGTCVLKKKLSIADTMALVNADQRLSFICDVPVDPSGLDVTEDVINQLAGKVSVVAKNYSVQFYLNANR